MALFTRRKPGARTARQPPGDGFAPGGAPATIGAVLRETRQDHGMTVAAVAAVLRIRAAFIEAIEEDRYDRLPGAAYALGFVRTYAEHLGLDGEMVVRRFKEEARGLDGRQDFSFPVPLPERGVPGGALLLVALIIAGCLYAVWYYRSSGEHGRPERVAAVPADFVPLPAAPPAAPPASRDAPAAPAGELGAASSNAGPAAIGAPAGADLAAPQDSGETPSAPAAPPPAVAAAEPVDATGNAIPEPPPVTASPEAPRVFGVANGAVRIVIKAIADSWVQVRDGNQQVLQMRVLKPGETYRVPDRPGLTLRTGNAGALEITVDGRAIAPIGPVGKTRNLTLDPEHLIAGKTAPE